MPGLQANYSAGLAAYATSATEIQQGLKDLSDGSDSAAEAHFNNAGSAMNEVRPRSRRPPPTSRPPPAEHERAASEQDQLAARSGRTLGTSRRT
jgi:hypothetical protein